MLLRAVLYNMCLYNPMVLTTVSDILLFYIYMDTLLAKVFQRSYVTVCALNGVTRLLPMLQQLYFLCI